MGSEDNPPAESYPMAMDEDLLRFEFLLLLMVSLYWLYQAFLQVFMAVLAAM